MVAPLRVLDCFSGTGGFTLAFGATGAARTVLAVDRDRAAAALFRANFPGVPLCVGDLTDPAVAARIPAHDVLVGGFPCQPWSVAAGPRQGGRRDPRAGPVLAALLRLLRTHRPAALCLENVPNLATAPRHRAAFRDLWRRLGAAGYHLRMAILDACEVTDLPQRRRRLYLVGFRSAEAAERFRFPLPWPAGRPRRSLADCLDPPARVPRRVHLARSSRPYARVLRRAVRERGVVYHWAYGGPRRVADGTRVPTLTESMGHGQRNVPVVRPPGAGGGLRHLTVREAFRLQGYPEDYRLSDVGPGDLRLWGLAGNAVSVPVVRALAEGMVRALRP